MNEVIVSISLSNEEYEALVRESAKERKQSSVFVKELVKAYLAGERKNLNL